MTVLDVELHFAERDGDWVMVSAGPPLPTGQLPRTRTGVLDWATFLFGLWFYLAPAVAAALVAVLGAIGILAWRRR